MQAVQRHTPASEIALALICMFAASAAYADTWGSPPTSRTAVAVDGSAKVDEFSSGNGMKRSVKVYARSAGGADVLSWEADLVNCPVGVLVAPRGETVVTMDSWGKVGIDAVVFYRPGGTIVKRYNNAQPDLITDTESAKVTRSVSSFWWDQEAHAGFMAGGDYFWVWLAWGRVLIFDTKTGNQVDAEALRIDFGRGRPIVLKTAEMMAESSIPSERIAAARLAGWLNGGAVLPLLQKLARDPYHEDTGEQTNAQDPWGRFAASALLLIRRTYPVRRAAAEELHIKFGQAHTEGIEELVPL